MTAPGPTGRRRADADRPGWLRRHRGGAAVALALLLLVASGGAWYYSLSRALGRIPTFSIDVDRPERPPKPAGDGVTFLLAGTDGPDDGPRLATMLSAETWQAGAFRSDALMVVHVESDRSSAQVISIPRDSLVEVPGQGRHKVNAAFSYGGPSLLVRTVEGLTGLRVDHVVLVDFRGFVEITDTLGGAPVTLAQDLPDPVTGTVLRAGRHLLDGEQALAYVRERKTLARGDLDRVQRQQNLVRALFGSLVSAGTTMRPWRMLAFANQLDDAAAVDASLGTDQIRDLAWGLRRLRPADVRFLSVPVTGTGTVNGASVVLLDLPEVRSMFRAVAEGNFESWFAHRRIDALPAEDSVP